MKRIGIIAVFLFLLCVGSASAFEYEHDASAITSKKISFLETEWGIGTAQATKWIKWQEEQPNVAAELKTYVRSHVSFPHNTLYVGIQFMVGTVESGNGLIGNKGKYEACIAEETPSSIKKEIKEAVKGWHTKIASEGSEFPEPTTLACLHYNAVWDAEKWESEQEASGINGVAGPVTHECEPYCEGIGAEKEKPTEGEPPTKVNHEAELESTECTYDRYIGAVSCSNIVDGGRNRLITMGFGCTAGFNVKLTSGKYATTTAGHCLSEGGELAATNKVGDNWGSEKTITPSLTFIPFNESLNSSEIRWKHGWGGYLKGEPAEGVEGEMDEGWVRNVLSPTNIVSEMLILPYLPPEEKSEVLPAETTSMNKGSATEGTGAAIGTAYPGQIACQTGDETGTGCGEIIMIKVSGKWPYKEGSETVHSWVRNEVAYCGSVSLAGNSGSPLFVDHKALGTLIGSSGFGGTSTSQTCVGEHAKWHWFQEFGSVVNSGAMEIEGLA